MYTSQVSLTQFRVQRNRGRPTDSQTVLQQIGSHIDVKPGQELILGGESAHYKVSYFDKSLASMAKDILNNGTLEQAYQAAVNTVVDLNSNKDQPRSNTKINIILTNDKFTDDKVAAGTTLAPYSDDGKTYKDPNTILISLSSLKSDSMISVIAHETTHSLFNKEAAVPFCTKVDSQRFDKDTRNSIMSDLGTLGESLAYYVGAMVKADYNYSIAKKASDSSSTVDKLVSLIHFQPSSISLEQAEAIYSDTGMNRDLRMLAKDVFTKIGLSLGGSKTGYDDHKDIHQLVNLIGSGDTPDQAALNMYGKSFDSAIHDLYYVGYVIYGQVGIGGASQ